MTHFRTSILFANVFGLSGTTTIHSFVEAIALLYLARG
jgi:hypothetical protein